MQKTFHVKQVDRVRMYPLGVSFEEEGLRISAVCEGEEEAGIVLYDRRHREGVRIPFPEKWRVGAVRAMMLSGYQDRNCSYLFYRGDEVYQDPCCKRVENLGGYGAKKPSLPRCQAASEVYDWENDENVHIPYEEMILYALHVRGFTKHRSSGVKRKGTYAVEKMRYAKPYEYILILMDIQMPVMDGRKAAEAIRKLENPVAADIPIIALSADAFESDKRMSMESGINAHLPKPVDVPQLLDAIAKAVQIHKIKTMEE